MRLLSHLTGDAHANGDCWPPTCGACIDGTETNPKVHPHELALWFSGNGTTRAECACGLWTGPRREKAEQAIEDHWQHRAHYQQEESMATTHPHHYHHVCHPAGCELLAHPLRTRLTRPLMSLVYMLAAPLGRAIDAAANDEEDPA